MLKTDFFRFFRFIGSCFYTLKLTTKNCNQNNNYLRPLSPELAAVWRAVSNLLSRTVWSEPVLLNNELNFASLARLELDQCLVNWPRPAGLIIKKFWAVGPWTQLPRSGRTEVRIAECVEYRIDASQNFVHQCLSKIVKDPRLTFHKDLGGRAHTHPTVLVTKINCVSKEVSGHVSKVILRWFLLWKMFRILKLGPKAIAQQTTTFKSPYNNPLLHCAVFLIGWPR